MLFRSAILDDAEITIGVSSVFASAGVQPAIMVVIITVTAISQDNNLFFSLFCFIPFSPSYFISSAWKKEKPETLSAFPLRLPPAGLPLCPGTPSFQISQILCAAPVPQPCDSVSRKEPHMPGHSCLPVTGRLPL